MRGAAVQSVLSICGQSMQEMRSIDLFFGLGTARCGWCTIDICLGEKEVKKWNGIKRMTARGERRRHGLGPSGMLGSGRRSRFGWYLSVEK